MRAQLKSMIRNYGQPLKGLVFEALDALEAADTKIAAAEQIATALKIITNDVCVERETRGLKFDKQIKTARAALKAWEELK